ncbi:MAG: chromosomal replication initiator protein DnaA, partial [Oscillospiraceae bacterium]|nr:chromosomal replication initiator protein DnaA [Oscillospiraceae bacterium]
EYLKNKTSDMIYQLWIEPIVPVSFENDKALLYVKIDYQMGMIRDRYSDLIQEGFFNVFGFPVEIEFTCDASVLEASDNQEQKEEEENYENLIGGEYNYTFETFIVGPSNNFAHAAAMAVANNPAKVYNPLFIYGDSGLGKTHLMLAVGNTIKKNHPGANIVYVKGEEFANDMITSIQNGTTAQFRDNYRLADVLLIDDIQFIGGKEATQDEFFHTFESLFISGKQIVITSDRPPKEIKTLEDRLRTRFESGLLADIQPPNFETRVAIINRKANQLGLAIPDNVTEFIANRIKSNVRQLEGAVKKLNAFKMLDGVNPTVAVAQHAIKDILSDSQPVSVTVDKILAEVARTYSVTVEDIKSKKKTAAISNARQIAAYITRRETELSHAEIGEILGGRHYSTIIYSFNTIEAELQTNRSLQSTIEDIIKNVKK